MFWIGLVLMISGLVMGYISIYKASKQTISPTLLGSLCYGGLFVAMIGVVLIGKVI